MRKLQGRSPVPHTDAPVKSQIETKSHFLVWNIELMITSLKTYFEEILKLLETGHDSNLSRAKRIDENRLYF